MSPTQTPLSTRTPTKEKRKRYMCEYCGVSFSSRWGHNVHIKQKHENKPRFKCQQCGKGYMVESHFTSHVLSHNNQKSFKCSLCKKQFAYKKDLTAHTATKHSEENATAELHECQTCHKKYGKVALNRHLKTCGRTGIYRCKKCLKVFKHQHNLKRHDKRFHSFDKENEPHIIMISTI